MISYFKRRKSSNTFRALDNTGIHLLVVSTCCDLVIIYCLVNYLIIRIRHYPSLSMYTHDGLLMNSVDCPIGRRMMHTRSGSTLSNKLDKRQISELTPNPPRLSRDNDNIEILNS